MSTREKAPNGKVLKSDVSIAKNYLHPDELEDLGRMVNAFLDLAESRAKRKIPMTMEDWNMYIDQFLHLDQREILDSKGNISHEQAKVQAETQREHYRITQDTLFQSDFDRFLEELQ